jgi:hypothetical protein
VESANEPDAGSSEDAVLAEMCRFICPAHSCWTCTQKDVKEGEQAEKGSAKKKGRKKKGKSVSGTFECKSKAMLTVSYTSRGLAIACCVIATDRSHGLCL